MSKEEIFARTVDNIRELTASSIVSASDNVAVSLAFTVAHRHLVEGLVFESPVRSGFKPAAGANRNFFAVPVRPKQANRDLNRFFHRTD